MTSQNTILPSGKSLFQLQDERILCVQMLAAQSSDSPNHIVPIHWYIMTSPFTCDITRKFFESRKYFSLEAEQVIFFQQGTLPCISADGRFIMDTPYKCCIIISGLERNGVSSVADILAQDVHESELPTRYSRWL